MTYAGERTIYDADSHLMELPDFLYRSADAATRRLLPDLGEALKWHDALGAFNGQERARALDLLGFKRQIVFSSFCARLIFGAESEAAAYGAAAAHNRSMTEFCSADPRLMGVAMVS